MGKQSGKPSARNGHAGFDVAGAGNRLTVRLVRHSQRKRGATDRPNLRSMAPVLDPTERRTEASAQARLLRPDSEEAGNDRGAKGPGRKHAESEGGNSAWTKVLLRKTSRKVGRQFSS